jgi:CheY-like chemotaxis protein
VRETFQLVERTIEENIRIRLELDDAAGIILVDPSQMQQVMLNVVINARDAMPRGGEIAIETSNVDLPDGPLHHSGMMPPGEYVLVTISDNGPGMTEEVKQKIFEPFFTTKESGKGTGLGLATVYGIVKQNGGFVWVYSEIAKGTTFKIYLPRVLPAERARLSAPAPRNTVVGIEVVLLVEDDPHLRQLFEEVLAKKGFRVISAKDAGSALLAAAKSKVPIEIIVTDVVMPGGKSGVELAQELKAQNPHLKIILLSGYTENSSILRDVLAGGGSFLQKPFSAAQLVEKVRQVLDQSVE